MAPEVRKQFRVQATDFTRERVLTWRTVVMVSGHKVSL